MALPLLATKPITTNARVANFLVANEESPRQLSGLAPARDAAAIDPVIEQIPTEFALSQNYPNPFNPTTTIQFDLPEQSMVTLKIYNMLGQEVATLLNREEIAAGTEELEFDASSLSSGVYLYRVVAESVNDDGAVSQTYTQVKKMVLMK